ncbi:hypothetical protein RHGRI_014392 [Rhododendron griersonianum]|uniref:Uncharacterized protein n=1 Tax=Rhododendron griersonianum TaxID=479676 RepID=A0AAV6K9C6_9ERIC|nr:hypothetical protein RHGRI_014392 [Rhododendron griersonianum]
MFLPATRAKANFTTIGGVVSLPWGSNCHPTPSAMTRCYRDPSGNSWPFGLDCSGGGLPPLGKQLPPDPGCHDTLLSRPLGQFLAFWPWLLFETLPVSCWATAKMLLGNGNQVAGYRQPICRVTLGVG